MHVIVNVLIFSDTIKFHKTDGCLFPLAVLVGASSVPSYWSDTIEYTCSGDSRKFSAGSDKTIFLLWIYLPEIVLLLFIINNIKISLRQLNRILKSKNFVLDIHLNILLKITFPMKLRQAVSALVTVLCGNGW